MRRIRMIASFAAGVLFAAGWAADAASVRNVYFTNAQIVPGQRYRNEGQLPGPTTTFVKGQDKTARLIVVLGDLDAHELEGELKAADGTVVRRFKQPVDALKMVATWRFVTRGFDLEKLKPGEYTLDLRIDGAAKGEHKFTLTGP